MGIIITDWLATQSIFYNIKTNNYSQNIIDVNDYDSFEWDYGGFVISKCDNGVEPLTIINLGNRPGFNYFFVPREKISAFPNRIEIKSTQ